MNALALNARAVAEAEFSIDPSELRVFSEVPHGCDVVSLLGMVVIFDTKWSEVEDGGYYVVERQRPVGGMSWETYDHFNGMHGPREPRCRIETTREVVQVIRRAASPGGWWHRLPSGFHDGPFHEWAVGFNFVGKVVGIYRSSSSS